MKNLLFINTSACDAKGLQQVNGNRNIMEEWSQDKPLKWSELPRGEYFFHATPKDRLESIKQSGLTTPDTHKLGKIWDIPFYPKERVLDRLFLFILEKNCLDYVSFYRHRKLVALRFKRIEISGASLFKDPGYSDNEISKLKPISFSANISGQPKLSRYVYELYGMKSMNDIQL